LFAEQSLGLVTNSRLFRKLYYQTMLGGTWVFWMLSSDYKVFRSTVIALNNFIQHRHWQVVQPFRLTLFLIKALITNHIYTYRLPLR